MVLFMMFALVGFGGACDDIEERVFRLHILANSDSEADQSLKLKVRDGLLEYSEEIFNGCTSKGEAIASAKENIDAIQTEAERIVKECGYDYDVKVEVTNASFDTRVYENFTLPAGNYDALRVIIGKGEGHNWWCVMYPQLCISASSAEDFKEELPDGESDMIEGDGYEIRFGIVDLFHNISNWFSW